ncbi:hypothetical protein U9M48_016444 [Paspalum notatum var. saurae]|uniref:Ribosomal RNA-processing protein 12-like conserved domain-containing protein n=1 Tax=Paspalum notatum var. saurae TaxID=547442 RepID=A0AAQ3WN65_PASNO
MKRKQRASAAAADPGSDAEEPSQAPLPLESFSGDACAALTARYGRSAAPQHRHLLATAAAIRSILLDDGLPLTPASYLPAAVSSLSAAGPADPAAASALASLLAILLPHVPSSPSSLPPHAASESASALAAFLSSPDASRLPTGTVRSVVKSLGHLTLHLDAAADWDAVAAPLEALFAASVDQRPKVRKCAQESVEKLFAHLEQCGCAKKASNAAIGMFEKHISSAQSLTDSSSDVYEGKETEAGHMLGTMVILVPYLSKKAKKKVFSDAYQLLGPCFTLLTRHVLRLLAALLDHLKAESVESEVESLVSSLVSYLPDDEKKPDDTIVSALHLMKSCLDIPVVHSKLWVEALPAAFDAASGYLILGRKNSDDIAKVLQDCIESHIDQNVCVTKGSQLTNCDVEDLSDPTAIKSICLTINSRLHTCAYPPESILTLVLALFLKLGESSSVFMKDILLTLAQFAMKIDNESQLKNVEECIGAALIAMGPDKVLSLIPIAFDEDRLSCSNTWLLPILEKYTYGAQLQLFLEHIVPLAKSVQNASNRVKKKRKHKDLKTLTDQLWNLLPSFCRYPIDVHHNFGSLSKLLVEILKCDECLYKSAVKALQQLVDGTRRLSTNGQDVEIYMELSALFSSKCNSFKCARLDRCSKKDARKNLKVLASHSANLLYTFVDYFLDASPENRAHLKVALSCLAQLSGSMNICNLFVSLVKRFDLEDIQLEPDSQECKADEVDRKDEESTDATVELNNKRSLLLELISTFAEVADEDLLDKLFGFIKSCLLDSSMSCHSKALFALSIIVKQHSEYSFAHLDEIMILLHGMKPALDNTVLENQLLCYQHLLVHMIKVNEENTSKKAFLILNELIVALKCKKESRKLAYDVLLATSTSLRSSESNSADSDLQRLFTMVMGYLSSRSPHIVSGAIAALSLLIYSDANFCLGVPNLIQSVLVLLQHKAIEIIKAALGFVKVLVTSLQPQKLLNLLADIMSGILKWSTFTKHHFKGKVVLILEILLRKCGFDAVNSVTPDGSKNFVRSVEEGRKGKHNFTDGAELEAKEHEEHNAKRRKHVDSNTETGKEGTPSRRRPSMSWLAGKKQAKDFPFNKRAGRGDHAGAKSHESRASGSKGDRTNFKSKSRWQPGNSRGNKGESAGSNKRTRGGSFNKAQNSRAGASGRSPGSKKHRSAATV